MDLVVRDRFGYLLKDRVLDVDDLRDTLRRSQRTAEAHVRTIMINWASPSGSEDHRRVLAVLAVLAYLHPV